MVTCFLACLVLSNQAAKQPSFGVLTVEAGSVQILSKGAASRLAGRRNKVVALDQVTVGASGLAMVSLTANRTVWRLPADSVSVVERERVRSVKGTKPILVATLSQSKPKSRGRIPLSLGGTLRGGSGRGCAPVGAIRKGPIRLTWTREPWASDLEVSVLDPSGKSLYSRRLKAGSDSALELPPALGTDGKWLAVGLLWTGPVAADGVARSSRKETQLRVLTAQELGSLEKEEGTLRKVFADNPGMLGELLGALYARYGLASDFDKAIALQFGDAKESADAYHRLGELYSAAGISLEADWAFGRARSLEQEEPWHSELASLVKQRDALMNEGKFAEALPLAEKVVAVLLARRAKALEQADATHHLGEVLVKLGKFEGAEAQFALSVSLYGEASASDTLEASTALYNLGDTAYSRRDFERAKDRWLTALAIRTRLVPGSLLEAMVLNDLGNAVRNLGELGDAKSYFEKALAIRTQLAPGSIEVAGTLNNLGIVSYSQGDLESAQQHYESALVVFQSLTPGSLNVAKILNNLGNVARARGDLGHAQKRHEQVLEIFERLAPNSLLVATSLNNLASVAFDRRDFDLSERFLERALSLKEQLAPGSLDLAGTLTNLGMLARARGHQDIAQAHHEAALAIQENLAPGSLAVATTLNGLANVAVDRGQANVALKLYQSVLAIQQKHALDSLALAWTLNNIGELAQERGDLDTAERFFKDSLAIRERLAPGSVEHAVSLDSFGNLALRRRDFDSAEDLYRKALVARERLAPKSVEVLLSLNNLEVMARGRGNSARSQALLIQQARLIRDIAARETSAGGVNVKLDDMAANTMSRMGLDSSADYPRELLAAYLSLRGISQSVEGRARASVLARETDPALQSLISTLSIAQRAEADWVQTRKPGTDENAFDARLVVLRLATDRARKAVAAELKSGDPRLGEPEEIAIEQILNDIPQRAALIEIQRTHGWDWRAKEQTEDEYGALVFERGKNPRWVVLGKAKAIDDRVGEFQSLISEEGSAKRLKQIGKELYALLIKPLGNLPNNLILAPDASLHQLPFAALVDGKGKFLVETTQLSIVGSGRDLVEKPIAGETTAPAVFSAPDYGAEVRVSPPKPFEVSPRNRGSNTGKWESLPGAANEGQSVAALLGVSPVSGAEANEERLMETKRPIVLHIATHGFFYPPAVNKQAALLNDRLGGGLQAADSPMLRSGLVLAGANHDASKRAPGSSDGWATALELSQMDLRGTELVVLSGCDTGRGDYRLGQGVFGLQRAFRFAGARSLVMSLFKVPDSSTKTLFESFYAKWKPGMQRGSKLVALRDAQLRLLKDPATRHPRHWAGFVLMGAR